MGVWWVFAIYGGVWLVVVAGDLTVGIEILLIFLVQKCYGGGGWS